MNVRCLWMSVSDLFSGFRSLVLGDVLGCIW